MSTTSCTSVGTQGRLGTASLVVGITEWTSPQGIVIMTGGQGISGYSGTAGDGFTGAYSLNGMQFSTRDRDNDIWPGQCAIYEGGGTGWWYKNCQYCNLNGPYICGASPRPWNGVNWYPFRGSSHSLKYTEMKIHYI